MTRRVFAFGAALIALVPFALWPAARAGDKGLDVKGEISSHPVKMEAGKLYQIRAEGAGFLPMLTINPGFFRIAPPPAARNATTQFFLPTETRQYRLYVTPNFGFGRVPDGALEYKLTVMRIPMSKKPVLKEEGKLTAADPAYENKTALMKRAHHKPYKVNLEAGQFYIIDMRHKGKRGFDNLDPFLYLEDSDGKVVEADDDGGGFPDARIVIRPTKSGEYRIIATGVGEALGEYTLTVRRQLKEKNE
jgi:hypothetical protein